MTLWKKIILWLVWSLSYGIMIIPNIYILIDNLIIGQAQKTQWSFGTCSIHYTYHYKEPYRKAYKP